MVDNFNTSFLTVATGRLPNGVSAIEFPREATGSVTPFSEMISDRGCRFRIGKCTCFCVGDYKEEEREESMTSRLDQSKPPTPNREGRPENFRIIAPGLYRSSYPTMPNFGALKELGLKTIITLVKKDELAGPPNQQFRTANGIMWYNIILSPNKPDDPEKPRKMEPERVGQVVRLMLEKDKHPLLVHCNKGKHRSGCIAAIYRRKSGWTIEDAIAEYNQLAGDKAREADRKFIASFDMSTFESKTVWNVLGAWIA